MDPRLLRSRLMPGDPHRPILVVEDDGNALSGYLEYLSNAGYDVVGFPDGAAALPVALRSGAQAVVTDIMLPGLTGFDLAVALQKDPLTQDIPVIGMTANWSREIHLKAADAHMCAVLRKPCVPSHLLAELERVLREDRRA